MLKFHILFNLYYILFIHKFLKVSALTNEYIKNEEHL
jgi:hypothetical protein